MTANCPLFSVIIPLYNKERYVERAIMSVYAQTCRDYEVVVVDDGSSDGSVNVVKRVGGRNIRMIHQRNTGEASARNRGIKEARGKIIAMLDADDEWSPLFLEAIANLFRHSPTAGLLATGYCARYSKGFCVDVTLSGGL